MLGKLRLRPDLLLLLSLLLDLLLIPVLDHGDWRRLLLGALVSIPVILSTVRLSQIRVRIGPAVLLMLGALVFAVASNIFANRVLSETTGDFWLPSSHSLLRDLSLTSTIPAPSVGRISTRPSAFIFCWRTHGPHFMVRWLIFTRAHSSWEPTQSTVRVP